MAVTNGLALPIPELTDTADGPDAISDLANATEDYVYDRILPAGVTRYLLHHWGAGTTLPTAAQGVKVGDTFTHTGLACTMRAVDPTATTPVWRQVTMAEVGTIAARDAISTNYTALLHPGFRVRQTDVGILWEWTGTAWTSVTTLRGKSWCTVSGAVINAGYAIVQQGASRLFGGFTFNAANNGLVIPVDGHYKLSQHAYLYGANGGTAMFLISRLRSGAVVDLDSLMIYKATMDTQLFSQQQAVPLLAGDIVQQRVYGYSASMSYGQNGEWTGCWVGAEYVGPLGGIAAV